LWHDASYYKALNEKFFIQERRLQNYGSNPLSTSGTGTLVRLGSLEQSGERTELVVRNAFVVELRTRRATLYRLVACARSHQSSDNVIAVVELPGMRKEDIDISLHDGTLTISGERKRESRGGEKAERTERYVGAFRRSITLPTRVDASKVSETYKDGILKVTLPKAEEAKPKQIQVS